MATQTEKRVIEIVVKATGDADLKRLARELAGMRKEAQAARKEMQQTNETLTGFGQTFGKVAKAFGAGFAIQKLLQSSEVIKDLQKNVQDLAGEFLDATLEASGFTEQLDDEFWMVATQGARDLGAAIGSLFSKMKAAGEDSAILKAWQYMQPAGLVAEVIKAGANRYAQTATFEVPSPLTKNALTEMVGDLARETQKTIEKQAEDAVEQALSVLRNRNADAQRLRADAREGSDLDRYIEQVRAQQPAKIDRNLESRLRNFAAEFDTAFEPVKVDIEDTAEAMLRMTEEGKRFQQNAEMIATTTWSWTDALQNAVNYMQELQDLQGDLTNQVLAWTDSLTYAFKGVLTGELHNARDVLRSITESMRNFYAELAARAAAQKIAEWVGVAVGALGGTSTSTSTPPSEFTGNNPWAGAKGGAFDRGNLIAMANGGIVSQPTIFPMARGLGLMGEAGPEAVMPLRRGSDGRLGVSASSANVVIENHAAPVSAQVEQSANEMRIVLRAAYLGAELANERINRSMRSGYGATAQSMQSAYGLRRRV